MTHTHAGVKQGLSYESAWPDAGVRFKNVTPIRKWDKGGNDVEKST